MASTTSVSSFVADNRSNTAGHLKVPFTKIRAASRVSSRQINYNRKRAVMVLTWQFVLHFIYSFVLNGLDSKLRKFAYVAFIVIPLSGWIADSWTGRYRVIKFCFKIMWLASLALSVTYLVKYLQDRENLAVNIIQIGMLFMLHVFMGCSYVNIIQFTMDQLQDASSVDIITCIEWLSWSYFSSVSIAAVIQHCTCTHYQAVASLVPFGLLSYVVCSDFLFNKTLTKEPVMKNALKQIFGVLKFSAANNHPQHLSSYAYWNKNGLSSRIDLAKVMYGGPYSNEEVEDVKTFFRIIIIFMFASITLTGFISSEVLINNEGYTPLSNCSHFLSCFSKQMCLKSGYIFITVCIPVWKILVYPLVRKHLPHLKILVRMSIGGSCFLLGMLITLILLAQLNNKDGSTCTSNITLSLCYDSHFLHWYILPSILNCIGMYLGMVAGIEFICAQCPYTMKGIVYGLLFFFFGIGFTVFSSINSIPVKCFEVNSATISREMFFLVINTSILALLSVIAVIGICCYKSRKREDISQASLGH